MHRRTARLRASVAQPTRSHDVREVDRPQGGEVQDRLDRALATAEREDLHVASEVFGELVLEPVVDVSRVVAEASTLPLRREHASVEDVLQGRGGP